MIQRGRAGTPRDYSGQHEPVARMSPPMWGELALSITWEGCNYPDDMLEKKGLFMMTPHNKQLFQRTELSEYN